MTAHSPLELVTGLLDAARRWHQSGNALAAVSPRRETAHSNEGNQRAASAATDSPFLSAVAALRLWGAGRRRAIARRHGASAVKMLLLYTILCSTAVNILLRWFPISSFLTLKIDFQSTGQIFEERLPRVFATSVRFSAASVATKLASNILRAFVLGRGPLEPARCTMRRQQRRRSHA